MTTAIMARMHHPVRVMACCLVCLAMLLAIPAQANPRYAAIVVDVQSGEILHAENADATRYPASLTKMMTLYLLFEALEGHRLSLDQPLPVSSHAASMPASKLYVREGSSITVEDAIKALTVKSANDVAVVVAEALGGTESHFARMMTAKAGELGMSHTRFRNASGLPDEGQVSSARDIATLSMRLMEDFPQYYPYFSIQSFTYRGTTHTSHNRLVRNYPGADGLKTGFIRASGFNVATSAVREGRRLASVVMGGFTAASRDAHMTDLLNRGFVRASLYGRGDWVAQADFSGERMQVSGGSAPTPSTQLASRPVPAPVRAAPASRVARRPEPAPVSAAPVSPPATQLASREPSRSAALPETAQGSIDDPIRDIISHSEPSRPAPQRVTQRLEPAHAVGDWGVQVGAFSNPDNARTLASRAADRLASELSGARITVDEATAGPQKVFRARLVNLDEHQAYRACRSLVQEGMDCMVVNASL